MRRAVPLVLALLVSTAHATTYTVAMAGGDFTSIQPALNVAVAGDTVQVGDGGGPWFERVTFPRSGNAVDGPIVLTAFPGEHPILDGTGVAGEDMILIEDRSWITVSGLEIRNNLGLHDGSGIRVLGAGAHVELRDNVIHDMRGANAMGITVYGTKATPVSDLVIDGNTIRDCEPAPSEAMTLNGNVDGFAVTNNVVRDVDNIGIVFIGGETDIQPDASKVARNGVCRGNHVTRARSSYGGGFAGGIYVDGGRDIVIEHNVVTESDLGLEVGAENAGVVAQNVVVRDNVLVANEKAGLVFGGYAASVGRVRNCAFTNNTVVGNDTLGAGFGELWIQYAEDNVVRNNVFVSTSQRRLLTSDAGNAGNAIDYNIWWTPGGLPGTFVWNGTEYASFTAYAAGTGADAHSLVADPLLTPDMHLAATSPAINAGDPAFVAGPGETDLDGAPRVSGPRVDLGVDEITCGDGVTNPGEECDDANAIDGDGCDSNCTITRCGNGVVTAGESCDDGNLAAGDCCSATCTFEASGAACDDGDVCTTTDTCDGAGACAGAEAPRTGCHAAGAASFQLKDPSTPSKRKLAWKWLRGDTAQAELGDPAAGGTSFALCAYDTIAATPHVALRATAPAGDTCRGKPCWTPTGTTGFKYAERELTPDGVLGLTIRSGTLGRARVTLKGKADHLAMPGLPLAQDPRVTVQLVATTGACWESVHSAPASKNDGVQFKDAGD
jgi:cysteine-rich repeat protein